MPPVKRPIFLIFVLIFSAVIAFAQPLWDKDIPKIIKQIRKHEKELGIKADPKTKLEKGEGASAFTTTVIASRNGEAIPREVIASATNQPRNDNSTSQQIHIRTVFDDTSPTIRKLSLIKSGQLTESFLTTLDNKSLPFEQNEYTKGGNDYKVYLRDVDAFFYNQVVDTSHNISLKEWVYAKEPNKPYGTQYSWAFESDNPQYKINLNLNADKNVDVILHPNNDYKESTPPELSTDAKSSTTAKKRISPMSVLNDALRPKPKDGQILATISKPVYWTNSGNKKEGDLNIDGDSKLNITIAEPKESYPLLIDPTVNYGQLLGGQGGLTIVQTLASESGSNEIYAGGNTGGPSWDQTISWQGTYAGESEGFVIEIADGGSPTLNWGQYIGGIAGEYIYALAVTADEIYVGGHSVSSVNFESVSFQGTQSGGSEAFLIEIADGGSPTLNWGQWFGTSQNDFIYSLAITNDEIYASGSANNTSGFEGATLFRGNFSGGTSEGFVVEIADGGSPTINWGNWLGGTGDDYARAVAFDNDEIYVAGDSNNSASWETFTVFSGSFSNAVNTEGFVVELADGGSPTSNWIQWIGGTGNDFVYSVKTEIGSDEIYIGGYGNNSAEFEAAAANTYGSHSGGTEGFVVEISDASTSVSWLQWIGGTGTNNIFTLAVTGNEIYPAGSATSSTSFETVTMQGSYSALSEGFIIEIDETTGSPALNWGQWIGSQTSDQINAVVIDNDEIWVGGLLNGTTGLEAVTFQGIFASINLSQSFIIEIADGNSPTLNWGQFLGGSQGYDTIFALAVTGDEIYAGGTSDTTRYWPAVTFQGTLNSPSSEGFVVEINDASPPTLTWGQWIGGIGTDYVYSLALTGDEIYASGTSEISSNWDTVSFQGSFSASEGFVVEIADGSSPALNWGQWLGTIGTDFIYAMTANGDEIYAGGSAQQSALFDNIPLGSFTASGAFLSESFLVELADGGSPTINWSYWLGGQDSDNIQAIAITDDEIYVGGFSSHSAVWEPVSFQGAHSGGSECFVLELGDATSPTLNWGQWLGGSGNEEAKGLALTGDEIYVVGYSSDSASWENVTFQGAQSGNSEGFAIEIADGGSPTLNWGQWLGGSSADTVYSIAVTEDEIYLAGFVTSSTSIELATSHNGALIRSEGFVVEIADGSNPSLTWLQYLGGVMLENFNTIAITNDEIYAAGYTTSSGSFESSTSGLQGTFWSSQDGYLYEISDDPSGTSSNAIFFGAEF